ncbi:MAG: hypothetical protein AUG74_18195 [Bacteroidetes bacterium 13_1_20CM_4_60_6]|nr:MAG: hypothetical protein AUG74_18195 [Bacteroidetes bacterium 13_1_20CM_4_60_6]
MCWPKNGIPKNHYERTMLRLVRRLWVLSVILAGCLPCFGQGRTVALTFDDLPAAGTNDAVEARAINRTILESLGRHHAPATAFVIEKRVGEIGESESRGILRQWVQHGQDLGNHSFSHSDFNQLSVAEIEREIVSGEKSIEAVLKEVGREPRYFRFPMNHAGDTKAKHEAAALFLSQRPYILATCTIENTDYLFNRAYLGMLADKDASSAERLRAAYLAYTSSEIDYYSNLNKEVLGYEPPEVMLLHANRLNADMIEELLALFEKKEYKYVSLDVAQSDPAYKAPDTFVSMYGPMWGYRWASERGVQVNGNLEPEPPNWVLAYAKSDHTMYHRYQRTNKGKAERHP